MPRLSIYRRKMMDQQPLTELPIPNKKPANPLANYFRQPKLYVKLPSEGRFYPEGSLDSSEIGEYAVFAMTAKDELMFKTPDALMNGSATVEVIKSCVPSIKNPWNMPSIDLDAVLIAIRIATYGEDLDITSTCPNCSTTSDFSMNLVDYLSQISVFKYVDSVEVPPLLVKIRPYTYKEVNATALKSLEQQKIFQIVNDDSMADEIKVEKFGESFIKLTELTVDVIAGCIESIVTPEGSVNDQKQIKEFIENAPSDVFNKINDHITIMKENMRLKSQHLECPECQNKWEVDVSLDQTNFFAVRS